VCKYLYSKCQSYLFLSAQELDKRVANELEAMEQNGVLANRWNGPIKREHCSEQCQAWSWDKNQTHQERLTQHDSLAADLEKVSIRHVESIDIKKTLQGKIKAHCSESHKDITLKQEIKILQKQIKSEKEKRCALKIERAGIKKMIQELKDSGLNGSRINGRRPTSSTPGPATSSVPTAVNPLAAPQSDIDKPLPNVNEPLDELQVEVPGMFNLL
jgi:ATP-dependent Lon protease